MKYLYLFLFLVLTVFNCGTNKNDPNIGQKEEFSHPVVKAAEVQRQKLEGVLLGSNEEGDFWYLFVKDQNGDSINFIYNSDEIFNKKDSLINKPIIAIYKEKMFEEAGSGDTFKGYKLLSINLAKN